MPVQLCGLTIDTERKEMEVRGTPMFPCGGYYYDLEQDGSKEIPWHWHEEIEVIMVCSGSVRMELDGLKFELRKGDGAFINSNVLHFAKLTSDACCTMHSIVFHPVLISGAMQSVFEQHYVRPLLNCATTLPGIAFYQKEGWQLQALRCIQESYDIYGKEDFGYELYLRELLSKMWLLILKNKPEVMNNIELVESIESVRIKKMLDFIQNHYEETIGLQEIAGIAGISERECLRCFQKTLGISAMQYLLKFRVSVSARMLEETNSPITEISSHCGFDSPSYFGKMFKRIMLETPSAYRKKHKISLQFSQTIHNVPEYTNRR